MRLFMLFHKTLVTGWCLSAKVGEKKHSTSNKKTKRSVLHSLWKSSRPNSSLKNIFSCELFARKIKLRYQISFVHHLVCFPCTVTTRRVSQTKIETRTTAPWSSRSGKAPSRSAVRPSRGDLRRRPATARFLYKGHLIFCPSLRNLPLHHHPAAACLNSTTWLCLPSRYST